jgi:hypothetical protein
LRAIKDCKCAVLAKIGVYARLNYRPVKANSRIGFDDSIICFTDAMNLGYSRKQCLDTIKAIIRIESKSFVVDKACGKRKDTITSFLFKYNLSGMAWVSFPWFLISMLPVNILGRLWTIFSRFKREKNL